MITDDAAGLISQIRAAQNAVFTRYGARGKSVLVGGDIGGSMPILLGTIMGLTTIVVPWMTGITILPDEADVVWHEKDSI